MQKVFCVTHICTNHSPVYSTPKPKLVSFNAVGPERADSMSKGTCHEGLTNTPELLAVRRDGDPAVGWPRCDATGGTVPFAWHTHSGQAQRDLEEGTVDQGLGMTKIPLIDAIGTHKRHLTVYSYVNNFYVNFTSINTHTYACMHSHTCPTSQGLCKLFCMLVFDRRRWRQQTSRPLAIWKLRGAQEAPDPSPEPSPALP